MTKTMYDIAVMPGPDALGSLVSQQCALAVYIGGKGSAGQGWTPEVAQTLTEGFLPVYCPAQDTTANAAADAAEALSLMAQYGADACAFDVEEGTVSANPSFWVDYISEVAQALHDAGKRVGLYTSLAVSTNFANCPNPPEFLWVGYWIAEQPLALDPHKIPGFPNGLWSGEGQRGWQYAHAYNYLGNTWDISVVDPEILTVPVAVAPAPPAVAPEAPPEPAPVTQYTVVAGDSLWAIAQKFNTTAESLYEANKAVIEAAAVHNGYLDSRGGALIWPGEVLEV